MVYPYTSFIPHSYYDVISQKLIEHLDTIENDEGYFYNRIGNSSELNAAHDRFMENEIRPLLFNYTTEEKEEGNHYISDNPNNLYLSRMFVYLVELTKGYLNEQLKSEEESASGLPSKVNCTIILVERLGDLLKSQLETDRRIMYKITEMSSLEIEELYKCALTFFACELVVFTLNDKILNVPTYIAEKTLEVLGEPSGNTILQTANKQIDEELFRNNEKEIFRLANIINDIRYGLTKLGGRPLGSNEISLSFFIAYLSDNKSVIQRGEYSELQKVIFSIFPTLKNSRFRAGEYGFEFSNALDRLMRNWEHDDFSMGAGVNVGNNLNSSWAITRAVFEIVPPPMTRTSQQSRTLNFSRRGFL